jgi:hypothetical protein
VCYTVGGDSVRQGACTVQQDQGHAAAAAAAVALLLLVARLLEWIAFKDGPRYLKAPPVALGCMVMALFYSSGSSPILGLLCSCSRTFVPRTLS